MGAEIFRFLSAFKWRCSRCQHWNDIEKGTCAKCRGPAQQFADAFRIHNKLTAEEENFYKGTAPSILIEVRAVRELLEQILREVEDARKGRCNKADEGNTLQVRGDPPG